MRVYSYTVIKVSVSERERELNSVHTHTHRVIAGDTRKINSWDSVYSVIIYAPEQHNKTYLPRCERIRAAFEVREALPM